jgi:hypothetical protein
MLSNVLVPENTSKIMKKYWVPSRNRCKNGASRRHRRNPDARSFYIVFIFGTTLLDITVNGDNLITVKKWILATTWKKRIIRSTASRRRAGSLTRPFRASAGEGRPRGMSDRHPQEDRLGPQGEPPRDHRRHAEPASPSPFHRRFGGARRGLFAGDAKEFHQGARGLRRGERPPLS